MNPSPLLSSTVPPNSTLIWQRTAGSSPPRTGSHRKWKKPNRKIPSEPTHNISYFPKIISSPKWISWCPSLQPHRNSGSSGASWCWSPPIGFDSREIYTSCIQWCRSHRISRQGIVSRAGLKGWRGDRGIWSVPLLTGSVWPFVWDFSNW